MRKFQTPKKIGNAHNSPPVYSGKTRSRKPQKPQYQKTEPEKKQLQMWKLRSRRKGEKKGKLANYQLPSVWMKRCKHKPISPALSYPNAYHPFNPDLPRKNSLSRRKRTKKIRDTKDPDNVNHLSVENGWIRGRKQEKPGVVTPCYCI